MVSAVFLIDIYMYSRSLSARAFVADFPPAAPEFHQRTHRVRLRNLGTTDKKSFHKIKHRKIPRVHIYVYQKDCRHHLLSGTRSLSLFSYYQLFFHHADSSHTYPSKISLISMFHLNQPSSPFMPLSHCPLPSCQGTPHTLHPRPCTQRSESVSDPNS